MHNSDLLPVIYTQGSLGASGDLAPLSHLSLPLIGLGEVHFKGKKMPAAKALKQLGWQPISLQSKEGLALINGTQFMSAYGMYNLVQADRLMHWANIIAAISFDAFDCSLDPLNENIHRVRAHDGQVNTAATLKTLLQDSGISGQQKTRCRTLIHSAVSRRCMGLRQTRLPMLNPYSSKRSIL